jgi:hypothetical protein
MEFQRIPLVLPSVPEMCKRSLRQKGKRRRVESLHFYHTIATATDNFIGHKIDTVHLIGMTRKVRLDFVRFQVPNLGQRRNKLLMSYLPK